MTPLLLLPLLALAPQASGAPSSAQGDGWRRVDEVVFQAGDEAITFSDVVRHFDSTRRRLGLSVTTEAEQIEYMNRSLESLVTLALEAQAGEDRDADPLELEERIDRFLASRREDRPLVDYVDSLEQAGISAQAERDMNKAGYYQSSFRSQGRIGPRPTRDGYVRPGELREFYRTNSRELLGGPPSYRFQDLVVTVEQVGGVEEARALATELRERLVAGEDFGELHDQYGTTEQATRGVTETFGPENPLPDPEARRLGETGAVGDLSPVLALRDNRRPERIIAFRVLRLYEKTPGTLPPPFGTALAQDALRRWAQDRRDEAWLGVARARLHRTAFLWPDPRTGAHGAAADPGSTAERGER